MIKTLLSLFVVVFFVPVRSNAYWILVQVKEISWQQNCIPDRQCDAMELSLVLDSNSETGSAQTSWKLDNVLKNPENSKMFVHWTEAQLTNITLKTLLTSNDVLFNIPRPCDHSSALHIFSPTIKASAYNSQQSSNWEEIEVDKRQTIGLVGKCFHVIIEVKLYTKCPWCYPPTTTKSVNTGDAFSISFNQILESPAIVAFVLFVLFVIIIGIILCAFNIQKRRKLQNYQQQYTSSSLSEMGFNRGGRMQSIVGNIPMPPMLRPPLIPDETIKCYQLNGTIHEPSICPYYETLDTHTLQKVPISRPTKETTENYDSAFDQSIGGSPNSSFSAGQNLSDSGRCSPQLAQQMPQQLVRPRAEYV